MRTLIKAKGLQHPYLTATTYSVFRVDKNNHRVSLVSKIIPSPDWIVGVSDFELCAVNGTWIEHYTYNLFPFDIGTDDGVSYAVSSLRFKEILFKVSFGKDIKPIVSAVVSDITLRL